MLCSYRAVWAGFRYEKKKPLTEAIRALGGEARICSCGLARLSGVHLGWWLERGSLPVIGPYVALGIYSPNRVCHDTLGILGNQPEDVGVWLSDVVDLQQAFRKRSLSGVNLVLLPQSPTLARQKRRKPGSIHHMERLFQAFSYPAIVDQ